MIENHTHARNKDYTGPEYDKIKIFENYLDDNPENNKIIEYASNFKDGMSLSMKKNGQILVFRAFLDSFHIEDIRLLIHCHFLKQDLHLPLGLHISNRFPVGV